MLERFIGRFSSFVDGYLAGDALDIMRITLKREHSLKVLDEARMITGGRGIAGDTAECIHVAALLHDVGRFPQYAAYRTFRDAVSVDHGRLGARVLRREGMLDDLPPRKRALILGAVIMHNRLALPRAVASAPGDDPLSLAVRVVRDADKLDIIRVMEHFGKDRDPRTTWVTMDLPDRPGDFSPLMVESIMLARWRGPRECAASTTCALLASWAFDFIFPAALRAFFGRNYPGAPVRGASAPHEIASARERVLALSPGGKKGA
jgi:hypothetical protein